MIQIKVTLPVVIAAILCCKTQANTLIKSIEINNNLAIINVFPEKITGTISCVEETKRNQWAIDISTLQGKKLYSLILGAQSEQKNITLTSGRDCLNTSGYERLAGASVKQY